MVILQNRGFSYILRIRIQRKKFNSAGKVKRFTGNDKPQEATGNVKSHKEANYVKTRMRQRILSTTISNQEHEARFSYMDNYFLAGFC